MLKEDIVEHECDLTILNMCLVVIRWSSILCNDDALEPRQELKGTVNYEMQP